MSRRKWWIKKRCDAANVRGALAHQTSSSIKTPTKYFRCWCGWAAGDAPEQSCEPAGGRARFLRAYFCSGTFNKRTNENAPSIFHFRLWSELNFISKFPPHFLQAQVFRLADSINFISSLMDFDSFKIDPNCMKNLRRRHTFIKS